MDRQISSQTVDLWDLQKMRQPLCFLSYSFNTLTAGAPGPPTLVSTFIWFFGAACSGTAVAVKVDVAGADGSAFIGCKTADVERPMAKAGTPPGENFRGFDSTT